MLREPAVLASRGGTLDVALVAAPGAPLAGQGSLGWGYNGTSPGPTLRVHPGDLLRVRLVNGLNQPTNLHTHGLHVAPQANSDNPFVTVAPGAFFDYAYRLPADHPGRHVRAPWSTHVGHAGEAAGVSRTSGRDVMPVMLRRPTNPRVQVVPQLGNAGRSTVVVLTFHSVIMKSDAG